MPARRHARSHPPTTTSSRLPQPPEMTHRKLILLIVGALLALATVAFSGADFTAFTSNAGNSFGSNSDFTNPSVTLANPGSAIHGTVHLTATATDADSGVHDVSIQYSPHNANSWTQ